MANPMAVCIFKTRRHNETAKRMAPSTLNAPSATPATTADGELGLTTQQLSDFERDGARLEEFSFRKSVCFFRRWFLNRMDTLSSTPTSRPRLPSLRFALTPSNLPPQNGNEQRRLPRHPGLRLSVPSLLSAVPRQEPPLHLRPGVCRLGLLDA